MEFAQLVIHDPNNCISTLGKIREAFMPTTKPTPSKSSAHHRGNGAVRVSTRVSAMGVGGGSSSLKSPPVSTPTSRVDTLSAFDEYLGGSIERSQSQSTSRSEDNADDINNLNANGVEIDDDAFGALEDGDEYEYEDREEEDEEEDDDYSAGGLVGADIDDDDETPEEFLARLMANSGETAEALLERLSGESSLDILNRVSSGTTRDLLRQLEDDAGDDDSYYNTQELEEDEQVVDDVNAINSRIHSMSLSKSKPATPEDSIAVGMGLFDEILAKAD
jgi:hypothetical protein